MEKNSIVAVLAIAAVVVVAVLLVSYWTQDSGKEIEDDDLYPITLTFTFDESKLSVACNGTDIKNSDTYKFTDDGTIIVKSKVGKGDIHYDGYWSGESGHSSATGGEFATQIEIDIYNTAYYEEMTGTMTITFSNDVN